MGYLQDASHVALCPRGAKLRDHWRLVPIGSLVIPWSTVQNVGSIVWRGGGN